MVNVEVVQNLINQFDLLTERIHHLNSERQILQKKVAQLEDENSVLRKNLAKLDVGNLTLSVGSSFLDEEKKKRESLKLELNDYINKIDVIIEKLKQ